MWTPTPYFRDFTRFAIFLIFWQGLVQSGWGEQHTSTPVVPVSVSTGGPPAAGSPASNAPAALLHPRNDAPLVQTPDFRSVISVGRTLSSVTVSGVVNNTLTITYSVYNLRGDPVNGVLLTTTLQPGATFQSAIPTPDQNGQQLAFSLGSLAPLGSASAQLTVTLANSSVTQIDGGASAFGYWDGLGVEANALAATLRTGTINSTLIQSTINANLNDTFVTGQAAQLGNDPNKIFQFVRDQIGYESYTGALRGARGTLWSMAGNSLDKASLLVALLRASGIPAQYVSGTLSQAQAQQLILSMFPPQIQLTGYVANSATVSNPAGDPTLLAEAETHYWVQFDPGTGFVNADPDFAGASIGQTFTASTGTFADVPSNLNQTVTVKLNVELYQQGLFGPIALNSTPLTQTFTTAELVGHPLTLGHFVQSQSAGVVFSATTNTYTPYLTVGQNDPNPSDDPIISGTQYQEVVSNFPFSSQVLTGVFLELDVTDTSGKTTPYTHTILDRIGYAAREGLVQTSISLPSGAQPALTTLDNVTISVESSLTEPSLGPVLAQRDAAIQQQAQQLFATTNLQGTQPSDIAAQQSLMSALSLRMVSATQALSNAFALSSQDLRLRLASSAAVAAYLGSPRLILASSQAIQNGSTSTLRLAFDRRKDDLRVVARPGQDARAVAGFNLDEGVTEGTIESQLLANLATSSPNVTVRTSGAANVFTAAQQQKIGFISITAATVAQLSAANYSADSKARITDAVTAGKVVIVPVTNVTLASGPTVSWYEIDPNTGATTDTGEDGNHQALAEFTAWSAITAGVAVAILLGRNTTTLLGAGCLNPNAPGFVCGLVTALLFSVLIAIIAILATVFVAEGVLGVVLLTLFVDFGYLVGLAKAALKIDPPVSAALGGNGAAPTVEPPGLVTQKVSETATKTAGAVQGSVQAASARATNQIAATWTSTTASGFSIATLSAANATVKNSLAQTVGTGTAALSLPLPNPATVSGSVNYSVNGTGDLSFYGTATNAIGASGNWTTYSATLTGSPAVKISTNLLTVNGSSLPQDTYTITAASVTVTGSGETTSPDFAGSASLTVTSGSVYLGPGSGTFTSSGASVPTANGIALDGFTGTLAITGNGTTDSVNLNGSAGKVLAVTPSPASLVTNENTPVTFASTLATSLADTYSLTAEAPAGWTVAMGANGNVTATPAPGLQSGTVPIFVTAVSQTDPNLVAQAAVLITLGATPPGVTLTVNPDNIFTVPVNGAQLPSAYRAIVQNTGPAADTFNLTFGNITAGFTILDSQTAVTIPAGAIASTGIYLSPTGNLPAPGTQASFTVTAASASNASIHASQNVTFTVPAVQGLTLSASPASFSTTPGTAVQSTLTLQSTGNVAVSATLASTTDPNLSLGGLSASVNLNPGQSTTQNLTLTPLANAPLTTTLASTITATFGSSQTATANIGVQVDAVQSLSAGTGAAAAAALGRSDIATTLSGLAAAINTALSSCSSASQAQVVAYVGNLIQEMNAPFLTGFVSSLQAAQSAIAAATCANIGTALTQLSTVLANLSTALSSPAALPFSFALSPNTALATPNQAVQFPIALQNLSTTTNTYNLSLSTLPGGVTGSLSQSSVTLGPGQSIPVPNALNNPSVSITPTTGTALQFSVTASINGVAGSGQTAYGTLTARNTFLDVEDVKATPGFTNAGGLVDVVTHIANLVNTNKTVQVTLAVKNSSNTTVAAGPTQNVLLSVQTLLTTVDFGQINTTGFANGNYSLVVTVIDPVTNQPMPGGTGTGTLLIGSPVTATLTASPQTLAPGNATVTSTLAVNTTNSGGSQLSLIGSVATASAANSVAVNGSTVYTCDTNEVSVINASNPANPTVTGTAYAGVIGTPNIYCDIQRGDLVMFADTGGTLSAPAFVAFDLTNPASPSAIASTTVNKRLISAPPYYQGNTAFFPTNVIFLTGSTITGQGGDMVSLDVTSFSAPAVLGTVETQTQGAQFGGSFNVRGVTPYNSQLAYVAATTSQGNTPETGVGQLWVVNVSTPASMSVVTQVNVPGTVHLDSPLVQGTTAVAIGDGGWADPCCTNGAYVGPIVVAVFNTTNPQSPTLVANVTTTYLPSNSIGAGSAVIGPNLFLYGGIMDASNNNYLMLVDTTNPASPVITTYPVPVAINAMRAVGTLLYAPTASGLLIYSIPGTGAISYTAAVQIAKNSTVAYNAGSFSVPPTSTVTGTGFDTVSWTNPPSNTITWTSNVTGIQAGQVLPIDPGATVSFTVPAGSGSITLPQADVNSGQILGLSPATLTVAPGATAAYSLTVNNPTAAAVVYNLAVTGVSPGWVTLQGSVSVPVAGQATIPLNLNSGPNASAGTFAFVVTATAGGASGSVQGTLILQGSGGGGSGGIGTIVSTNSYGVSVSLIPVSATGGQGTPTQFVAQIANVGDVTDTYTLSVAPVANATASLSQTAVQVPPGLSNFRQVPLTLTAATGAPAGPINFAVKAVSNTSASVASSATGTLNVVNNGVRVALSPASASPGGTFQMTVTNTGRVSDTFALALGGPAAAACTLASSSVSLAAGASRNVAITIGASTAFTLGSVELAAQAVSQGNSSVSATGTALITIAARKGVSATFNPASQTLAAPGPAVFELNVLNTGTVQDSYSATIASTSGPVKASLVGLDGKPAQSIATLILPGVGMGQLVLDTTLTGAGQASVTVKITSLTNSGESVQATATLGLTKPVSNAGKNQNVLRNAYTSLNGSDSYDPGGNRLTYKWTMISEPCDDVGGGSGHLRAAPLDDNPGGGQQDQDQDSFGGKTTPRPYFNPSQEGKYVFQLVVNNGATDSAPSQVTITAYNDHVPPTADAGDAVNAKRGSAATVDGSLSHAGQPDHPDKPGPINFYWTMKQVPAGSHVTNASISGNTHAMASFVPDVDGVYVLTLTVSDSNGSSSDDVTVTALDSNVPPNAVAGSDRRILLNLTVTLDGSHSNDPDNGPQPLSYRWRFVFSQLPDSALVGATTAAPHFTPVSTGFYVARLDVSDGAASSFDQMTVMAAKACDANADGVVNQIDLDLMNALVGQTALPGDPLDPNKDGVITDNDVDLCAKMAVGGDDHGDSSAPGGLAAVAAPRAAASPASGAVLAAPRLAVTEVRNGASLVAGAVAPGEIVVITGSGFGGPATFDAQSGARRMPVTLGGVQVLFDGTPAPLLYVTPNQLTAVVPHTVGGKSATTLVVTNGSSRSDPVVLPVAASAPGIFTMDGTVQTIAVNEDGSMNSAANPAAAGTAITLFLQGAGQTEPPDMDGLIVADERVVPRQLVRAWIGDSAAEVLSAAGAPGTASGVMRVEMRIPMGAPPSAAAPIRVMVGGSASQPGVTIAIR